MTKQSNYILLILVIPGLFFSGCHPTATKKNQEFSGNKIPRNQSMEWFREAKFGMFIHRGPYSCLAGEWNGVRQTQQQAEWIMKYLKILLHEYHEFPVGYFNFSKSGKYTLSLRPLSSDE